MPIAQETSIIKGNSATNAEAVSRSQSPTNPEVQPRLVALRMPALGVHLAPSHFLCTRPCAHMGGFRSGFPSLTTTMLRQCTPPPAAPGRPPHALSGRLVAGIEVLSDHNLFSRRLAAHCELQKIMQRQLSCPRSPCPGEDAPVRRKSEPAVVMCS